MEARGLFGSRDICREDLLLLDNEHDSFSINEMSKNVSSSSVSSTHQAVMKNLARQQGGRSDRAG